MAERFEQLERALGAFGRAIDFPAAGGAGTDLASSVASRLRAERAVPRFSVRGLRSRRTLGPVVRPAWHTVAAASLVILLAAAGTLSFSASARDAVAGWLGLRGVHITIVPSPPVSSPPPSSPSTPLGSDLALGQAVTLEQAQQLVGYRVLRPAIAALGQPDVVYESSSVEGGLVSMVYGARRGIARQADGVAVLFVEFRARLERRILLEKFAGPGTTIEAVRVNGEPGFWLSGAPHELVFRGPDGQDIPESVRLAGNVLVWEHRDLVLRLEGNLTKAQALRIAGSVR